MTTWKGFDLADLERFGIRRVDAGIEVPYFSTRGKHWRSKLFRPGGGSHWLGSSKAQIPYGLETLRLGGDAIVLTEGESDALALRLAFPKLPVLGIPGASSWRSEWTGIVDDFAAVYLSLDGDKAGEKATKTIKAALPHARAIRLPAGADTRDVLQGLGRDAYKLLVAEARVGQEVREAWRAMDVAVVRRQEVDAAWARLAEDRMAAA